MNEGYIYTENETIKYFESQTERELQWMLNFLKQITSFSS